jgi:GNAT superfamily N-acetyltransferase
MNSPTTIRQATMIDLDEIIVLGEMLQNDSKDFEPKLIFNREESFKHYKAEMENANALIIVAEKDNKIVGYQYSFVTELDYLSDSNMECTLEALYVLPDNRSMGIGKQLVAHAEDWAVNTKKVNRIKANIYCGNTASEELHIKNGFKPYNTEYIKLVS